MTRAKKSKQTINKLVAQRMKEAKEEVQEIFEMTG